MRLARRDERGARRRRERHIQSPFTIHVTGYPAPPGRVPRLRKRVQTDKSTLNLNSLSCPSMVVLPPNLMHNVPGKRSGGR